MKYLTIILLCGCSYDDNCGLKKVENQLRTENKKMGEILKQEWTSEVVDQIAEEMDIIESLEIEKTILKNNCK